MFRFFPFPTETGLRAIGAPDTGSPVFVTCNFDLTVRRVTRALRGLDCYLLVAPSKGINVWCAAGGGMLNAHSITSVLKTSRIAERVNHRTLILPQLSAPGVDVTRIEEESGWHCEFGPVYARDIPAYVAAGFSKTGAMRQARFPLADRLEMAAMWATPMSIVAGIPMAFVSPSSLAGVLALIWLFSLFLFICYEPVTRHVPGPVGLVQTLLLGLAGVAGVSLYGLFLDDWSIGNIAAWGIGILAVALVLGFDLDGSSPLRAGSTVAFWGRKWPRILEVWARLGYELEQHFVLRVDMDLCKGCATCVAVCPKGVFDLYHLDGRQKAWLARPAECEQCTACVKQCPEGAVLSEPPVRTFAPAGV
jgi:NAD-dependent dihydropyrimidine dehydrogenase PreA subunit